jgi:hypothetical protein
MTFALLLEHTTSSETIVWHTPSWECCLATSVGRSACRLKQVIGGILLGQPRPITGRHWSTTSLSRHLLNRSQPHKPFRWGEPGAARKMSFT